MSIADASCRIAGDSGARALALTPDLATLLAPLGGWGEVRISVNNGMGDSLATLRDARVFAGPLALRIEDARHTVLVGTRQVASCRLVDEERDGERVRGLKWLDRAGRTIGQVALGSGGRQASALAHLEEHAMAQTTESGQAHRRCPPDAPGFVGQSLPWETIATGPHAAEIALRAVLAASRVQEVALEFAGPGMAHRYRGPISRTACTLPTIVAGDAACRLRFRPESVAEAGYAAAAGADGLRFSDGDGGLLAILPLGQGADDWLASVLREVG